MKPLAKGAWVVTGAASGFGRELARQLSERGESLALWDRDAAGLEETRALVKRAETFIVDVTDPTSVHDAAMKSREALGPLAHVVNSAGVLRVGRMESVSAADHALMMQVNYLGSVHVAQAMLPHLRETSGDGRSVLLFIASVAGLRGFPELAGYSASKFAVVGFAQALRDELTQDDIDVRVLCPPPGDTPMVQELEHRPAVYDLSRLYTAEEVVTAALKGIEKRRFLLFVDAGSKSLHRVGRVAPGLVDYIVRRAGR